MDMKISKIDSEGMIDIPLAFCEILSWEEGDEVSFEIIGNELCIRAVATVSESSCTANKSHTNL
jgi:antitoxin component of MazEF toxin-antitoxin module